MLRLLCKTTLSAYLHTHICNICTYTHVYIQVSSQKRFMCASFVSEASHICCLFGGRQQNMPEETKAILRRFSYISILKKFKFVLYFILVLEIQLFLFLSVHIDV